MKTINIIYKRRGDEDKNPSIEQYLDMIKPYLNEEIKLGNETDDVVKRLINSFLNNYQKEELILRNRSNFIFESVGLLTYHIHKTSLKRGN